MKFVKSLMLFFILIWHRHHGEKFDPTEFNIDAISPGHKIYGPKGVGALILNQSPSDFLSPISYGGLQEQDVRSSTVPVFNSRLIRST